MKRLFTIIAAVWLSITILQAAPFHKTAKYRTLKVEMNADKPLSAGENLLKLTVTREGKPLVDADVALKIFMPAMPGMPYMETKTRAKALGNGLYEARFNVAMGGTWQVHIFITTKEGKKYRVKTSLNL